MTVMYEAIQHRPGDHVVVSKDRYAPWCETGECTPYANILLQSGVAFGTPTPAP